MKWKKPHALVGKRIKYRYEGGWEYHVYYESENKVSYDVVSGPFGSRKASQVTHSKEIAPNVVMVGWYEETGTIVVQTVNLNTMTVVSFAGFPRWVFDNPEMTHGKKEDTVEKTREMCKSLPDAPREVFFETATIFSVEEVLSQTVPQEPIINSHNNLTESFTATGNSICTNRHGEN